MSRQPKPACLHLERYRCAESGSASRWPSARLADLDAIGAGDVLLAKRDRLGRDVITVALIERLVKGDHVYSCALVVHDTFGTEARILKDGALLVSHLFREGWQTLQWAEEERNAAILVTQMPPFRHK